MSASTTPYKRAKASSPPETTLGSLSFRENGTDEERERERERERDDDDDDDDEEGGERHGT